MSLTRGSARRRALTVGCIALLTGFAATSCSSPDTVCTAVGWMSTAYITLAEPREGLTLRLSVDEECAGVADDEVSGDCDFEVVYPQGSSADGWSASVAFAPSPLFYRLTDVDGLVVAGGSIAPEWRRVGGSAECGGPSEALVELPA